MPQRTNKYKLVAALGSKFFVPALFMASTLMTSCASVQQHDRCDSGQPNLLINGSFEETSLNGYTSSFDLIQDTGRTYRKSIVKFLDHHPDTDFPGWFTTGGIALQQGGFSKGGTIEVGQDGFLGIQSPDGRVFAEMDGNHHNQIVNVVPGQKLVWQFSHRGRKGTDTVSVSIGAPDALERQSTVSSSNAGWSTHRGQYVVPENISELQITITPVRASDGDIDSSHLLDDVKLCYAN